MKLKLPAYGAPLRAARRAGEHPLCVHVIFGDRWREPVQCSVWARTLVQGAHPVLAVRPSEYAAGTLDWSVVTGLRVAVFDQNALAADVGGPLFVLLGELGRFAADIEVHSAIWSTSVQADELALMHKRDAWPAWWTEEVEKINEKRRANWFAAAVPEACA